MTFTLSCHAPAPLRLHPSIPETQQTSSATHARMAAAAAPSSDAAAPGSSDRGHAWHTPAARAFMGRLGLTQPIVLAPMAGVSSPALTAAVCKSGGLGLFGAATMPAASLKSVLRSIQQLLPQSQPQPAWGVNLFAPPPAELPPLTQQQAGALEAVHAYYAQLAADLGLDMPDLRQAKPLPDLAQLHAAFEALVQVLLDAAVPVISFYFGLPAPHLLARIKAAGVFTLGTATCLPEARQLEAAGIDAIVLQGSEAGGHRGTWYSTPADWRDCMMGTLTLIATVAAHVKHTPLLAAGGIMSGQQVVAALAAGAAGVQLGTVFLTCDEAATHPLSKQLLLAEPERGTTVTQAFTGRPARGLVTRTTRELAQLQEQLPTTLIGLVQARPFYAAAAANGHVLQQLCGQGYPLSRQPGSAAALMHALVAEADAAAEAVGKGGGMEG